jgi:hypothetical protein
VGGSITTRSRGRCSGEGLALGTLARKPAHRDRLGNGPLGGQFVFRSTGLQLFEGQGQLIDQPR